MAGEMPEKITDGRLMAADQFSKCRAIVIDDHADYEIGIRGNHKLSRMVTLFAVRAAHEHFDCCGENQGYTDETGNGGEIRGRWGKLGQGEVQT